MAKPNTFFNDKTVFDEEFTIKLDENEQVVFKLVGILIDNNETDLGTIKYQLQLNQLFD